MSVIAGIKTDNSQARGFPSFPPTAGSFGYTGSAGVALGPFPAHSFLPDYRPRPTLPHDALATLAACAPQQDFASLTGAVAEDKARLMERAFSLISATSVPSPQYRVKLEPFVQMSVPLRCVALLALLYAEDPDVNAMLCDWTTWDVFQVAMNFRIIIQAVLRTLGENHVSSWKMWLQCTHLLEPLFSHDVATTAMQVASSFQAMGEDFCAVNCGRSPQGVLNCLQDLLEYAPTSLSRRVKTRLVHAAIAMSNAFDIHPHRLVLKNHLQLCGQDPVASGSFGDVWKGILNGEHVSVKVFRTYQNGVSSGSKDFTKEAMIWRQLNHPNVLPFYGVYYLDDARNRLCLVSPWMEEGNVVNYLQRCPSTNRVALAYDIANGLAYLHGEKVVHGDLKGVNILVSESGKACIGDFGLASITDVATMYSRANPSSASSCHGTIRWLAPEVMETGHATERSDIYAFACVLYELFAGHPPFVEIALDATVMWKVAFQQQRPARPPSAVLSDAVWQLITRCWAHDFATRPSAEDALFALRAELAVTPDAATWDPSIPSRIRAAIEELPFCPTEDSIKVLTRSVPGTVPSAAEVAAAPPPYVEAVAKTVQPTLVRTDGRSPTISMYGARRPRSTTLSPTALEYVPRGIERSHSEPWLAEPPRAPADIFACPLVRPPAISVAGYRPPAPASGDAWMSADWQVNVASSCEDYDAGHWSQWLGENDTSSWGKELVSWRTVSPAPPYMSSWTGSSSRASTLNPNAAVFMPFLQRMNA